MTNQNPRSSALAQLLECTRKDILAGFLSQRYELVLILTVVMAIGVTIVRTHIYRAQVRHHHETEQEWRRTMESVQHSWQSIGLGLSFEKSPEPLAIFAFGLENELTRSVNFCEYYPDRAGLRKLDATSFRYFSQIDLTGMIYFGYSLLALMLVFDAISASRERGTLRILMAGPVARSTVILGKILAGFITVALPLCIAWGISVAYVMLFSGHIFVMSELARIGCMIVISLLYIGTIFALGLGISAWAPSSNAALIMSLFVWLLLVLFLPSGAKVVCDAAYPILSFASIEQDKEAMAASHFDDAAKQMMMKQVLSEQPNIAPEKAFDIVQQRLADKARRAEQKRENLMLNNVMLFGKVLRVSPSWSYLSAATSLAGTGTADYLKFLEDVRTFRREFEEASHAQKRAAEAITIDPGRDLKSDRFSADLWPVFTFKKALIIAQSRSLMMDFAWLTAYTACFLLVAITGFMRREL